MTMIFKGVTRWIVSYLVVILFIMLMPIFLLVPDFAAFDNVMNFLFNNNK